MLVYSLGDHGMAGLALLLDEELSARGWNQTRFASESKISKPTVSRILNDPEYSPDLKTMAMIAATLQIPLRRVLEANGYDVEATHQTDDVRLQSLLRAVPELQLFLEPLMYLTEDDRLAVLTYAEMLLQKRQEAEHQQQNKERSR